MTETVAQVKLRELQEHLTALQELSRRYPEGMRELLPAAIEDLKRSMQELQEIGGVSPQGEHAASPAATNGPRVEAARLAVQYTVTRVLSEAKTLEEAAPPILQAMCEGLNWEMGELWSIDAKTRALRRVHIWPSTSPEVSALLEDSQTRAFPPTIDPPGHASGNGSPVWTVYVEAEEMPPALAGSRTWTHEALYRRISAFGETCAIFQLSSRRVRGRHDGEVHFLTAIASQIGQFMERRLCEVRIRESEAWKTAMLEASLDAVITIDGKGRVVEFNSVAERTFGYDRVQTIGRQLVDLIVPPRLREGALASFAQYRATGESGLIGRRVEAFAMRSDGSEFPVEVAVTHVAIGAPPMLTIHVRDATARRSAEEEVTNYQRRLRSLTAELLVAEERERRRLSIDLHDGLSQTIALAQIKLGSLRRYTDAALSKSLDEIERLIDQANQSARSITFELSPPVLHDLGLEPAVQWLVENIQARYGIETVFEDDGQHKPADERTRVILFRSIRELLINAAKHASARRVHVRLEREDECVNVAVEDDGIGMEPVGAAVKGSGLFSIRERLEHVGGNMCIESVRGQGTRVRLCAPLSSQESREAMVSA